ncbi:UDP-N-acetylmuramate--L-alanine ligase [Gammaproteobacteria bacterium]|nr:UDP-N-acetylmuramate--L-alanine ligase [Gammaproteobacteria bacterium]
MGRIKHIHFVGIGGSGMVGIAEVILSQGYRVSGSDLSANAATKKLKDAGAEVYHGHHASHIENADVVVRSSAVDLNNVELVAAKDARIPIVRRAEMLGELMRFRYGVAIAGTHGKTTTTSLITSILAEEGVDPTFVIGGKLNSAGGGARLGAGRYLIAEADESDASFLYLNPMLSVITNIDADHMATYQNDFSKLRKTFIDFLNRLPFYGLAVLCIEDPEVKNLLSEVSRPYVTYGFEKDACYRATLILQTGTKMHFVVERKDSSKLEIKLNLPGKHNVLNALAAIAVATELKISDRAIQYSLENFSGIDRRFQIYGDFNLSKNRKITLVDDYGHHPREIAATLEAAKKSWLDSRFVMVYQPHRYTRTKDLFDDFVSVLSIPDILILLDVYSAGEEFIPGADSLSLKKAISEKSTNKPFHIKDNARLAEMLNNILKDGDILIMQGAGNIGAIAANLSVSNLEESILNNSAKEVT